MADDTPFGFAKPLAIQLRNLVREQGQCGGGASGRPENRRVAIAETQAELSPGTEAVPTSVTIKLQKYENGTVVTTAVEETAYNHLNFSIPSSQSIGVIREYVSGKWIPIPLQPVATFIVKTPSGGIPALSGTTPGTATVELHEISGTTLTQFSSETGYNIDCTSIPGSIYTCGYRDAKSGSLVVQAPPVTDLRLDGSNLQYKRGCTWTTWTTGTECPPA